MSWLIKRCDEIIVGCIYYGANLDGVECCAKYFPKGSFLSPSGACVSTHGAPVINQVDFLIITLFGFQLTVDFRSFRLVRLVFLFSSRIFHNLVVKFLSIAKQFKNILDLF